MTKTYAKVQQSLRHLVRIPAVAHSTKRTSHRLMSNVKSLPSSSKRSLNTDAVELQTEEPWGNNRPNFASSPPAPP